jgi:hypothetical protein
MDISFFVKAVAVALLVDTCLAIQHLDAEIFNERNEARLGSRSEALSGLATGRTRDFTLRKKSFLKGIYEGISLARRK